MLLNLILFIVLLSVIILIHEFGHLVAAKFFGVYCGEFSLGMGPKLWSYKGKETEYSLRALPLGGFVAMAGDSDNDLETSVDVNVPLERSLKGVAHWKRIIIMLAGIFMNFVLAILIIGLLFLNVGSYTENATTKIATVEEGSPAYLAGMQEGDEIISVSFGNASTLKPDSFEEIVYYLLTNTEGEVVNFEVLRDGQTLNLSVTPSYDEANERYVVGISAGSGEKHEVNFFNCWGYALDYCWFMIKSIFLSLKQLIRGIGLQYVSGPVGIYQMTSEAASYGFSSYLMMIAVISLNIGVMNLLPLPILDGGRVLLCLVEMIIGKPLSEKVENALMMVSLFLILGLFLFSTFNDILRLL